MTSVVPFAKIECMKTAHLAKYPFAKIECMKTAHLAKYPFAKIECMKTAHLAKYCYCNDLSLSSFTFQLLKNKLVRQPLIQINLCELAPEMYNSYCSDMFPSAQQYTRTTLILNTHMNDTWLRHSTQ